MLLNVFMVMPHFERKKKTLSDRPPEYLILKSEKKKKRIWKESLNTILGEGRRGEETLNK